MKEIIPTHIYVIGAGGVSSYLLPPLLKTLRYLSKKAPPVTVFDGDKLEPRNLERQLFVPASAEEKEYKASALVATAKVYEPEYKEKLFAINEYFHGGIELADGGLLFICVDNHVARKAALQACDRYYCNAVIAANEYTDSQAIWYNPFNSGTILDPRVRYPEILSDESGDPTSPVGCTAEAALQAAPQLAIANMTAAAYALQLFWFYCVAAPGMDKESRPFWPVEHGNNFNKISTKTEKVYA